MRKSKCVWDLQFINKSIIHFASSLDAALLINNECKMPLLHSLLIVDHGFKSISCPFQVYYRWVLKFLNFIETYVTDLLNQM